LRCAELFKICVYTLAQLSAVLLKVLINVVFTVVIFTHLHNPPPSLQSCTDLKASELQSSSKTHGAGHSCGNVAHPDKVAEELKLL